MKPIVLVDSLADGEEHGGLYGSMRNVQSTQTQFVVYRSPQIFNSLLALSTTILVSSEHAQAEPSMLQALPKTAPNKPWYGVHRPTKKGKKRDYP